MALVEPKHILVLEIILIFMLIFVVKTSERKILNQIKQEAFFEPICEAEGDLQQIEPTCKETLQVETTTEPVMQEFIVTAYCPCEKCCGKWAKNRKGAVRGCKGDLLESGKSIAVDFKTIPYGSVVVLDGKEYKAVDCGGAVKGNHIDIYFDTHEEAVNFGKQVMKGYVKDDS